MPKTLTRIASALLNNPWAIQESWLQEMYAIFVAQHDGDLSRIVSSDDLANIVDARGVPIKPMDDMDEERNNRAMLRRGVYRRGSTAIIPIRGPIFPYANMMTDMCGATSLSTTMSDYREAENDPSVRNIVIPADSPGGSVVMVDEFYAMIKNSKKPTYGHVTGNGASAMYWLLCAMDSISLSPTSSVGSIGVIMSMTKFKKQDDEYPKKLEFVSSISPKKILDPESDSGKEEIYRVVNKIAEVFAMSVSEGRNVSLEDVKEKFGQGGMITGDNAVEVGMADRVDTLEALLSRLDEEESTSYSSYGDTQMKRNEYKDKFPDEYNAILEEGKSVANADLSKLTASNSALEQDNLKLQAQIDKAKEINEENDSRLKALEKVNAINAEKANQLKAEGIFDAAFTASRIPARLEDKVRRTCATPEAFTQDGVLDAEGYKASVSAEMADWAKSLNVKDDGGSDPILKGFGASGSESNSEDEGTITDAAADAMFNLVATK
jgi:ClpP class serine protease